MAFFLFLFNVEFYRHFFPQFIELEMVIIVSFENSLCLVITQCHQQKKKRNKRKKKREKHLECHDFLIDSINIQKLECKRVGYFVSLVVSNVNIHSSFI